MSPFACGSLCRARRRFFCAFSTARKFRPPTLTIPLLSSFFLSLQIFPPAPVRTALPLAAYFYLLIHLTTSPQFDTIRLYVIVVRYIFRRKTNKFVARGRVRNNKEKRYEKNLPTQKTSKKQSARFPRKNEDNRRSSRACSSSQQGSSRTLRLIEAIREVYLQT